jgi:trigger factor
MKKGVFLEYQIINETETEKEIEFKLGAQELEPFIESTIEKLRPKISIRGYRKGKAPKSLIRTKYYDTLKAEAINDLILDAYKKILEEKKWHPASNPELVSFDDSQGIKFNLRIEILPDFDVDNYTGLEVFKEEPLPVEYLYEQTLNRLREDYADIVETARPAAVDDFITLDLEIYEDDKSVEKQADIVIKLGDRSFPDELNRALVGVKKGDRKEVHIDDKIYKIKIKKVEEKILPQVNEEFARLLKFESLEDMEKGIKEMVEHQEEERLNEELKENLAQILLERFRFPVPRSLVEHEYQMILRTNNLSDNDSNRERYLTVAENRARLNLILDRIAEKEKIEVVEDDILKYAERSGFSPGELGDDVKEFIKKIVMRDEVFKFLLKNANITKKSRILSPEEAKNVDRSIRH